MKVKALLAAGALATIVAVGFFFANGASRGKVVEERAEHDVGHIQRSALAEALLKANSGERAARTDSEAQEQIARLEARLSSLEEAKALEASDDSPKPVRARPGRIAEANLASWMKASLDEGGRDNRATYDAQAQLTKAMEKVPGTKLDDVSCGPKFCRAVITSGDGAVPKYEGLLGSPPIVSELFTVTEQDGQLSLYFTRQGATLQDLRKQALAETELANH